MKKDPNRKQGYVPVTELQLRKRGYSGFGGSSTTITTSIISLGFETTNYVIDGALYKITIDLSIYGVTNRTYLFQIYETDDGSGMIPRKFHQGDSALTLWFNSNVKNITVVIVY